MIHLSLFGKQKSLESSQESWNQAKISKDSESRQTKSIILDPLIVAKFISFSTTASVTLPV